MENLNEPNKELEPQDKANELESLTEQNWLFINAYLQCGNINRAYKIAGYKGQSSGAPYALFKVLKSKIEHLGDLDVTSRARLQADLAHVLNLPISKDKQEVSLSEWLKIRKFAASITPEATQQNKQISVLVINRSREKAEKPNVSPLDQPSVIDITPLPNQDTPPQ